MTDGQVRDTLLTETDERRALRDSVGYGTTATCRVSWASSRTLRPSTSCRSTAPSRKRSIARFSATDSGLTAESRSTKSR